MRLASIGCVSSTSGPFLPGRQARCQIPPHCTGVKLPPRSDDNHSRLLDITNDRQRGGDDTHGSEPPRFSAVSFTNMRPCKHKTRQSMQYRAGHGHSTRTGRRATRSLGLARARVVRPSSLAVAERRRTATNGGSGGRSTCQSVVSTNLPVD